MREPTAPEHTRDRRDDELRGKTRIPARVVARIAEQAASEVPHTGAAAGGVLGVGARRDFGSRPSAECRLYGRAAVLRLDVGIDFPTPLAHVTRSVRDHVREQVEQLTGLEIGRLDVAVSWLNPAENVRRELR